MSGTSSFVVQSGSIDGGLHVHPMSHPTTTSAPPQELAADVHPFVARREQLAEMDLLLADGMGPGASTTVSVVSGTAGVGKTAFVTHWAHRVHERFPDGQLYVNLHGYGPHQAVPAAEVLAGFLRSLGVPNADIPPDLDERAARFRSTAARKRLLIVLDNARTPEQVRPLLPGTPSCVVVVTSRDTLLGLVSGVGAQRVNLDLLPIDEAIALLRELIGPRVDTEPTAAAALATHCARLPLALRIAAELARANRRSSLAALVDDLADDEERLDLLDTGDDYTAVREVLSWSYNNLERDEASAFRLLGLHPGRDFDEFSVAVLVETTAPKAKRLLGLLARANLIEQTQSGRYEMHDLLRVYAAHLVSQDESRGAALGRLFDFFLSCALAAVDVVFPQERDRHPRPEGLSRPAFDLTKDSRAVTWLEAERATLLAVAAQSVHGVGRPYTILLSATLSRYLDTRGHFDDAVKLHEYAVDACQKDDLDGSGQALRDLGSAYQRLGIACQRLGRYQEALRHLRRALDASRRANDDLGQAFTLINLGFVRSLLGRDDNALTDLETASDLFAAARDRMGQAHVLNTIGFLHSRANRYEEALEYLQRAMALFRETSDRSGEGFAVNDAGVVLRRLGRHDESLRHHAGAFELGKATGDRSLQAAALNGLGNTTRLAHGAAAEVLDFHVRAIVIARDIGDRFEEAQAHEGFADAHEDLGNIDESRDHLSRALAIYTGLGVREAEQIAVRISALEG
jgi:tetratricopeptide (TPR) repeat protein